MTSHAISRITFSEIWATTRWAIFSTMSMGTPTSAASDGGTDGSGAPAAMEPNEDSGAAGSSSKGSGARLSGSRADTPPAPNPRVLGGAGGVPGRSACRTQPNPSRTVSGAAADGTDGDAGEPLTSCVRTKPKSSVCALADGAGGFEAAALGAGADFSSSNTSSNAGSGVCDSTLA